VHKTESRLVILVCVIRTAFIRMWVAKSATSLLPVIFGEGGGLDKKISTYMYNSRRIAMYVSLLWLRTRKIVRPSGSNAGLFMCYQYMLLANINLLNKMIYLNIM
jgi:hypothetical protein